MYYYSFNVKENGPGTDIKKKTQHRALKLCEWENEGIPHKCESKNIYVKHIKKLWYKNKCCFNESNVS